MRAGLPRLLRLWLPPRMPLPLPLPLPLPPRVGLPPPRVGLPRCDAEPRAANSANAGEGLADDRDALALCGEALDREPLPSGGLGDRHGGAGPRSPLARCSGTRAARSAERTCSRAARGADAGAGALGGAALGAGARDERRRTTGNGPSR